MCYARYESPLGPLTLTGDGTSLTGLRFGDGTGEATTKSPLFSAAFAWLDRFFSGQDPGQTPPLAPAGTEFGRDVWRILQEVPFGQTLTYGELSRRVAACRGKASPRAIGQAVHSNPIPILIPCHRVLGAGGRLTGYAWGLDKKRQLLMIEESHMRLLFTLDAGNYAEGERAFSRPSARAIVIQKGRVAMVYSQKYGHYKFPGGGIERGETREEALFREAKEEAGLILDESSIRPYGFVHRIERGAKEPLFLQDNFYYLADAKAITAQELDGYEAEEGYTLRFVTPAEAIAANLALTNPYKVKYHTMLFREARVLQRLQAEGLL